MTNIRPAHRVGSWVKFSQPNGTVAEGTIQYAVARHWITHKPAYHVQANAWNGDVHETQVLEYGPVRV